MMRKTLAVALSLLMAVLSWGPNASKVFAGELRTGDAESGASSLSIPLAPAGFNGNFSAVSAADQLPSDFELPPNVTFQTESSPIVLSLPSLKENKLNDREIGNSNASSLRPGLGEKNKKRSPLKTNRISHPTVKSESLSQSLGRAHIQGLSGRDTKVDFDGDGGEVQSVTNNNDTGSLKLSELKQVLADGPVISGQIVRPFSFHLSNGNWASARDEGLEGFLYSKLELEHQGLGNLDQLNDYFHYLDAVLSPFDWASPERTDLKAIASSALSPQEKNEKLNDWLIQTVSGYQARVKRMDPSLWTRKSSTYMVFSRAYNRLKSGQSFFDSIDQIELQRIHDEIKADSLWLMDIFEIGDVHRWGTGGGSSYSIKGYRVKPELGGEEGFRNLILRAQAMGLKVGVDFIPNHVSLDSDFIKEYPEGTIHIVPPQDLSDDQIMSQVPRHNGVPVFYLLHTNNYPENGRRVEKKILVQYPLTDFGGEMWSDLAQMDYSRPETRQWELDQTTKMFGSWGLDFVRRDMAYEILNTRYFPRWLVILQNERDQSSGWAREALSKFIEDFKTRWQTLSNAEFMAQMAKTARKENPAAGLYDEAYSHTSELSRSGSNAVYNKSDHDQSRGQYGLYDALVSASSTGNVSWLMEALKNVAFRMWQQGGATMLNFVGTHDGGEGNPIDKFGRYFKAAALTAVLFRPILTYNGLEQGVGQARNLIGNLSQSVDTQKAIPFDIPVLINWNQADPDNQEYLKKIWTEGEKHKEFIGKSLEILNPQSATSIVAWSAGHRENGVQKALIGAANFGSNTGTFFNMDSPVLKGFGAFKPRADRDYILRDALHLQQDGTPVTYLRHGADLLKKGLYIGLDSGGTQLFEVEEVTPELKSGNVYAHSVLKPLNLIRKTQTDTSKSAPSRWDAQTQKFVKLSWGVFGLLQFPQIWANTVNLASAHAFLAAFLRLFGVAPGHVAAISGIPFFGVLSGMLADGMLMSYFTAQKEYAPAIVQTIGVVMATIVLSQVAWAGFVPLIVCCLAFPLVIVHLALNAAKWRGKLPEKIAGIHLWDLWPKALSLLGLFILPVGVSTMFSSATGSASVGVPLALGAVATVAGLGAMIAESRGKLPEKLKLGWATIGAWLATLLFMFMPLAQIRSIFINPVGLHGLALPSFFMGTLGNILMLPRAVFTKNRIWFVGSGWAVLVGGIGVFLSLAVHGVSAAWVYLGISVFTALISMGYALKQNQKYFKESSLWRSLDFLFSKK